MAKKQDAARPILTTGEIHLLPWSARLARRARLLRETILETARGFRADRGNDLASSLAFATLLAAVPLLATFSLLLAAFFQENVGTILDTINAILPYHSARVTDSLREFVAESTAISGIGLAILLVASVRLIFIVEGIFNAVWGAPRRRRFWSRLALYTLVLFALALLLGSVGLGARLLRRSGMGGLLESDRAGALFPFVAEVLALTLLYRYLPNARVRLRPALVAAATIAFSLEALRALFGLYVRGLSRMNLITGTLTLVLLTLVSIYLVWALVLLGVELTHVLQIGSARRRVEGNRAAGRAEKAIRMLLCFQLGETRSFKELSDAQQGPTAEAQELLECLQTANLIRGDTTSGYELVRRPGMTTLAEVVDAVSPNLLALSTGPTDPVVSTLAPLFHRLEGERRAVLGTTLAELRDL
ncbi:MAG TPA: YhjD/YihY/BrkB family envelope integrity protein [Thermoanaerobaculia bacterium]|nr:YhjD/YihY/BrkB family envelope integrity protein [Thermoanaerobaculia bacterium]